MVLDVNGIDVSNPDGPDCYLDEPTLTFPYNP